MSAPIIFGAGLLQLTDLIGTGVSSAELLPVLFGFLAAAITGFLVIKYLLRYLRRHSLYIFAIYVWVVAALSLLRAFLLS